MCNSIFYLFVIALLYSGPKFIAANKTLENTAPTNWGFWGNWEFCPPGSYASGFQLKTQGRQWRGDDTALNAIQLLCARNFMAEEGYDGKIMSKEGAFGEWGQEFRCKKGYLTGFQLQSEPNQGEGYDSTAANNLRAFCSNSATPMIQGDGMNWGSWGLEERCMKQQALCGIKTQVSWNLYSNFDNVGLNNVHMECCDLPDPLRVCIPKDDWELAASCDNIINTASPLPCNLDKKIGLDFNGGVSYKTAQADFAGTMTNLGFTLDRARTVLQKRFSETLAVSNKTTHDWSADSAESWANALTTETHFNAPLGKLVRVYQVVGSCGPYSVRTAQFKKEESDDPF